MIKAWEFEKMTGFKPENDDLERANCNMAGNPGHWMRGICLSCNKPRFVCGCGNLFLAAQSRGKGAA